MAATYAVVGAGYGDEGKGLAVDYLVGRQPEPSRVLVVRHNGGAQAGHTVERHGERHVFKHFGSGTLAGAPTFWAASAVAHPLAFYQEHRALRAIAGEPGFYCDPQAPVTTMLDMVVNQRAEHARGGRRHGSCGMGVNEVVTRALAQPGATIRAGELFTRSRAELRQRLDEVRDRWLPARCAALGFNVPALAHDRSLDEQWLDACEYMARHATPVSAAALLPQYQTVVFEGAQGLRLDEYAPGFPHVTRSRTGLTNPVSIAAEANLPPVEPWYVTRWYLTRHGAGPLAHECTAEELSRRIADQTNRPNPHQGSLRFAPLCLDALVAGIRSDWHGASKHWMVKPPRVLVTCMNHLPLLRQPPIQVADGREFAVGDFVREIAERLGAEVGLSAGGSAEHIEESVRV